MMRGQTDFGLADGYPAVVIAPPEIDTTVSELLHSELLAASRIDATVILDMTKTTFCDSSALHMLMRVWRRARAGGGELILVGVGSQVARILDVMGVDRLFVIRGSVDEAMLHPAAGRPPQRR